MKLLLDVGNTRLKWALWADGRFCERGHVHHGGAVEAILAAIPEVAVAEIRLAQVLGVDVGSALVNELGARRSVPVLEAKVQQGLNGLGLAYAQPERLGVDRWLGLLAARQRVKGPVVVASAGTALTLDAVAADGQHLGGFIAPGYTTALKATLGATRFRADVAELKPPPGLGRDTEACVLAGACLACLGALDRGAALAPPESARFLTGGDAEALLPSLSGWLYAPDLILEGLLALPG